VRSTPDEMASQMRWCARHKRKIKDILKTKNRVAQKKQSGQLSTKEWGSSGWAQW